MSQKAKRSILALFCLSVIIGLVLFAVLVGTGRMKARAQALPDVGKFRAGSALGEERAGFSGRAKLQVFASFNSPAWPAISECLQSAAVESEMNFFTGVLVDEAAKPEVEAVRPELEGLRVVVRGLNGAFLGGLRDGFSCRDLSDLSRAIPYLTSLAGSRLLTRRAMTQGELAGAWLQALADASPCRHCLVFGLLGLGRYPM